MCGGRHCAEHFYILINSHHNPGKEALPPHLIEEETELQGCPIHTAWPIHAGFWFKQGFMPPVPCFIHNCPNNQRVSVCHFIPHPEPIVSHSLASPDHYGMQGGGAPLPKHTDNANSRTTPAFTLFPLHMVVNSSFAINWSHNPFQCFASTSVLIYQPHASQLLTHIEITWGPC